jgi:hypothetical protein
MPKNPKEDEMSKIILEVEDNKLDQLMTIIDAIKSDIITSYEVKSIEEEDVIDEKYCLEVLDKINRGDYSSFEPIGDIDEYIAELKNAIA